MPSVNWERIKTEYITGYESQDALAKRYGVRLQDVSRHSAADGWVRKRAEFRAKVREESDKKSVEKIADAESDIAASKARIRRNIIMQIETRLSEQELDTGDFRRLVQCYKDMEEIDVGRTEATESEAFEKLLEFVGGSDET